MKSAFVLKVAAFVSVLFGSLAHADGALSNRDITRGEAVYQSNCAACHGAQLEGQPDWRIALPNGALPAPPHDATGHTWHHDDGYLIEYTTYGGQGLMARRGLTGFTSAMPAFGGILSEDDILNVLAFIRSTWPDEIKQIQAGRNAAQ